MSLSLEIRGRTVLGSKQKS